MAGGSTPELGKGTRVSGEQRDALTAKYVEQYNAGESIRGIAGQEGRSYGFVHGVLKQAGVGLRSRGGATRGDRAAASGGTSVKTPGVDTAAGRASSETASGRRTTSVKTPGVETAKAKAKSATKRSAARAD